LGSKAESQRQKLILHLRSKFHWVNKLSSKFHQVQSIIP
jgi:hypothetical protein